MVLQVINGTKAILTTILVKFWIFYKKKSLILTRYCFLEKEYKYQVTLQVYYKLNINYLERL
jgi:hypothetical protein